MHALLLRPYHGRPPSCYGTMRACSTFDCGLTGASTDVASAIYRWTAMAQCSEVSRFSRRRRLSVLPLIYPASVIEQDFRKIHLQRIRTDFLKISDPVRWGFCLGSRWGSDRRGIRQDGGRKAELPDSDFHRRRVVAHLYTLRACLSLIFAKHTFSVSERIFSEVTKMSMSFVQN